MPINKYADQVNKKINVLPINISETIILIKGIMMAHFFPRYNAPKREAVVINSTFGYTCQTVLKRIARTIRMLAKKMFFIGFVVILRDPPAGGD